MRRLTIVLFALAALLGSVTATSASTFPDTVELPDGFAPEGIAIGKGTSVYTGSLAGVGIWRGDLRTGEGSLLVEGGGPFVGMKVDARDRLWVAGGPAGTGYTFDADTGRLLETFTFATEPTFVNDVIVTQGAAYFTDSMQPALYRVPIGPGGEVGTPATIDLDADDIGFVDGEFNLNGIVATPDGQALIVVNSTAGALYAVDPETGEASEIDLAGASVANGDGLLLHGRTLYVVRNMLNLVAVVELSHDRASGSVVDELTSDDFDIPTTIARFGDSLYVVNARFGTPVEEDTEYWITRIDR